MLSGRGFCDGLITRPEESYRLWCVVVCDLENLKNEEIMTCVGSQRHSKKKKYIYIYIYVLSELLRHQVWIVLVSLVSHVSLVHIINTKVPRLTLTI